MVEGEWVEIRNMTKKVRRQYYSKKIYRLWMQYIFQMDWENEPLKSIYADWDLEQISPDKTTGKISKEDFNIWWDSHWKDLFGEPDFSGEVSEINSENTSDDNYLYVNLKIEIPPERKGTKSGKGARDIYDDIVDKAGKIIRKKLMTSYRSSARFPITKGQPKIKALEENLEIMILQKRHTTKQITQKASFFDSDTSESARKMRISRGLKSLQSIKKNIAEGRFP